MRETVLTDTPAARATSVTVTIDGSSGTGNGAGVFVLTVLAIPSVRHHDSPPRAFCFSTVVWRIAPHNSRITNAMTTFSRVPGRLAKFWRTSCFLPDPIESPRIGRRKAETPRSTGLCGLLALLRERIRRVMSFPECPDKDVDKRPKSLFNAENSEIVFKSSRDGWPMRLVSANGPAVSGAMMGVACWGNTYE